MCGGTPDLLGAARTSHMYFASTEVAEVAACTLAELTGGVMEVARASTKSGVSAPSSSVGGAFYIGDSDEQEASGTNDVPAATEPTTVDETAAPLKSSSEKDGQKSHAEDSDVVMKDDTEDVNMTSSAAEAAEAKKRTRSGASAPNTAATNTGDSAAKSTSSTTTNTGAGGVQQQGAVNKGSASSSSTSKTSAVSTKFGKPIASNADIPATFK